MIEDLKKKVAGISGGSTVTITPTLQSGDKLADYSIDGTAGAIYAPENVFSTTETKVGKWGTDDLYRKVIVDTINLNSSYEVKIASVLSSTENLKYYNCMLSRTASHMYQNGFALSGDSVELCINADKDLAGTAKISTDTTATCILIIYYTKTETETKTTKKKK